MKCGECYLIDLLYGVINSKSILVYVMDFKCEAKKAPYGCF